MYKPIRLTKETARVLIERATGMKKIEVEKAAAGVYRYFAQMGSLEICCENDWHNQSGRYELHITDGIGGNCITMFFHPDTLDRDFAMEQAEKDIQQKEARVRWVGEVGRDIAHKLVDQYWDE